MRNFKTHASGYQKTGPHGDPLADVIRKEALRFEDLTQIGLQASHVPAPLGVERPSLLAKHLVVLLGNLQIRGLRTLRTKLLQETLVHQFQQFETFLGTRFAAVGRRFVGRVVQQDKVWILVSQRSNTSLPNFERLKRTVLPGLTVAFPCKTTTRDVLGMRYSTDGSADQFGF